MILNKNILAIRWGTQLKHFLKLSHKYASILCYEIVLPPSLGFKLNPFVPPRVSVSLFSLLTSLIYGPAEHVHGSNLYWEATGPQIS